MDPGRREVRVTFSTAPTRLPFRNGMRITDLRAETSRWVAATVGGYKGGTGDVLDRAQAQRPYVAGTRTCLG